MAEENWYCAACGGLNIHHDAVARYNPKTCDYETITVLDDTWCEDCREQRESDGDPMFGSLPEKEGKPNG